METKIIRVREGESELVKLAEKLNDLPIGRRIELKPHEGDVRLLIMRGDDILAYLIDENKIELEKRSNNLYDFSGGAQGFPMMGINVITNSEGWQYHPRLAGNQLIEGIIATMKNTPKTKAILFSHRDPYQPR